MVAGRTHGHCTWLGVPWHCTAWERKEDVLVSVIMVPFLVVVRWFGAHLSPALTRFKNMTRNRQLRFSCVCHSVHHHFHRVCGQSSQLRTLQVTNSSRTKNHQAANKQSYFHTAHHHQSLYNLLHSYMARKQQQEECIYNWGPLGGSAAAADAAATVAVPRVKTYNYSAPPAAAPRRMHEDSSQVRGISTVHKTTCAMHR